MEMSSPLISAEPISLTLSAEDEIECVDVNVTSFPIVSERRNSLDSNAHSCVNIHVSLGGTRDESMGREEVCSRTGTWVGEFKWKRTSSSVVDVLTFGATISARCRTLCHEISSATETHDQEYERAMWWLPLFWELALGSGSSTQDESITRAGGYVDSFRNSEVASTDDSGR